MDSLFVDLLPAAVEEFSGQYPAVTYAITAVTPWDVASKVLSGEYDVGITFISKLPAGLDVMTQVALPPGVVMASSHPLARKDVVSFADCRSHAFLRLEGDFPCKAACRRSSPNSGIC